MGLLRIERRRGRADRVSGRLGRDENGFASIESNISVNRGEETSVVNGEHSL